MRRAVAGCCGLALLAAAGCGGSSRPAPSASASSSPAGPGRVLLFTKTAKFRHASIPAAVSAVKGLSTTLNVTVDATEDAGRFTTQVLGSYDAVVFLNTTGDVLDDAQQAAFEGYIRGGGGFAGVHSATDTEYGWAWYGRLVGAYFKTHPRGVRKAVLHRSKSDHPSIVGVPDPWERTDEWYDFRSNPRGTVHVLLTIDEATYAGGGMGADHPVAWCQEFDGGRSWYTAGGHTPESFREPAFLNHLAAGILWAAGRLRSGACAKKD